MRSYPYIGKGANSGSIALFYKEKHCITIISKSWATDEGMSHKVADESYFKDITADYLRNTYGEVESKEHADFITWLAGNAGINVRRNCEYDESLSFFCVHEDKLIFLANKEVACDSNEREIKLQMPPQEKQVDEWPQVGDDVAWGEDGKSIGYVLSRFGDYVWVRSDNVDDNGSPITLNVDDLSKPPTQQEKLTNEIYNQIGSKDDSYALAKAILAGEIEGLVYKGD